MSTTLIVMLIVCGLMMMFGATKWALGVAIASVVGYFCYRIWTAGQDFQSVSGDVFFCFVLLSVGWYAAKRIIKFEDNLNQP